jgi:ABC-2 type transport system ATP-binding protein
MSELNELAIDANRLEVRYKSTVVLRGLTIQVRRGEVYALLGGNGAGKSTTLNAFLGFVEGSSGTVQICGLDPSRDPVSVRAQIAYVPENVALYEHLTARENISYFLRLAGTDTNAATIEKALSSAKLDSSAWDRHLGGFSKGMRQKVAIALALARSVPVLLLDEPTTGLDPQATSDFNQLLKTLKEKDVAVFMVTHDLLGAAEVADRIGFLDRGVIIEEFTAAGPERFDIHMLYKHYAAGRAAA